MYESNPARMNLGTNLQMTSQDNNFTKKIGGQKILLQPEKLRSIDTKANLILSVHITLSNNDFFIFNTAFFPAFSRNRPALFFSEKIH
jgi:hypothetical protein